MINITYVVGNVSSFEMLKSRFDPRWLAFFVLCLGSLMIVLDTTIVNVALPTIHSDLGFTESALAWVINAYVLMFGGFLLLGGRLGDLYGNRKLFIGGIVVFTFASLLCGFASSQEMLIAARALQGLGGAVVSAVGLSLMLNLFTKPNERAQAMGVYGFVAAGGGSIGVFLGGLLVNSLGWHSIFLVNIPVGIGVVILSLLLLPKKHEMHGSKHLDILGAILVTSALIIAVYSIVTGNEAGWLSIQTIGLLLVAIVLFVLFLRNEHKVTHPLVPLGLFKVRSFSIASFIGILWSAAMFAWFFLSALYLQVILNYSPLQVGLSFLPANIIMAVCSIFISAKIVMKFGIKAPIVVGMLFIAAGLGLFAIAPINGSFWFNILPSMSLLGFGCGIALNPVILAAMSGVPHSQSGLASGIVNTSFMMGGALGLAILASLAAFVTQSSLASGETQLVALLGGYHMAFLIGAFFALSAGITALVLLKEPKHMSEDEHQATMH